MKKASHTPGPWHYDDQGFWVEVNGLSGLPVRTKDRVLNIAFALTGNDSPDSYTAEANARLISCAPEMLEALEELIRHIPAFKTVQGEPAENTAGVEAYRMAKLIISKAKGL